jgi:hypothetical protein
LKELIPTKSRELVLHIGDNKGSFDDFVGEFTSAKQLLKQFV